jgi:hypothetical protein
MKSTLFLVGLLAVSFAAALPSRLFACSVPVFRYALENWEPDPYLVEVSYSGALKPEEQATVDFLNKSADPDSSRCANIYVRSTDVKKPGTPVSTRPTMVLRFPVSARNTNVIWSGELHLANASGLMNSPVRQEVARRIVAGDSAVWILLQGGNKKKDSEAAALLKKELKAIESEFKLPELTKEDADRTVPGNLPEVRISFSMINLSRQDQAENILVASLLRTELGLLTFKDEPMAFPVFGQGRALYGLVGKGITTSNIRNACGFLVSACSCLVKQRNPGTDLLMTAAWCNSDEDFPHEEMELPPLTRVVPTSPGGPTGVVPVTVAGDAETREEEKSIGLVPVVALVLVGLALVVVVVSSLMTKR